jgi:23S rRNA pseudouridine2605 synthase
VPEEELPGDLDLESDPTPEAIAEELLEEEEEAAGKAGPAKESGPRNEERLQKILAHAGIASRRHAEELISEGRVQVNGQTITTPGFKADPERDHIRVDGKLLHGSERLRYFVLNKPRGFVTTVSDPEGRPTVMQFFSKLGERLYPVGRLDFQSEGLLLVTNDGPLANQLTRAASGVEKTYLVKVSGQPDEEALNRLSAGVTIHKGKMGEKGEKGRVRTAPARIRLVRAGENPWYEIVLIEGRNRELRKMFEEIGHHVEKIRRVAYGPLVLDIDPGTTRELSAEEVDLLRRAAQGKYRSRKIDFSVLLPKEAGRTVDHEAAKERAMRPYSRNFRFKGREQRARDEGQGTRDEGRGFERKPGDRPAFGKPAFGSKPAGRPFRKPEGESRPFERREGGKPAFGKPAFGRGRSDTRPGTRPDTHPDARREGGKPAFGRPAFGKGRPGTGPDTRPDSRRGERPARPGFGRGFGDQGGKRPGTGPDTRFDKRPPQRPLNRRPSFEIEEAGAPPREGFGGREQQDRPAGRFQDRRPDRNQNRNQEQGQERGFRERPFGQRGSQSFRPAGRPSGRPSGGPRGERGGQTGGFGQDRPAGGFDRDREGGGKNFGGKPAARSGGRSGFGGGFQSGSKPSGGKPGFKSGPKPGGSRPGFKSGSKPGFKSGGPRPGSNRGRGKSI